MMRFISLLVILACTLAFALASPSSHEMYGRNIQEAREAAEVVNAREPTPPWKREAEAGTAVAPWKREPTPPGWKREAEAKGAGGVPWKRENKNRMAASW